MFVYFGTVVVKELLNEKLAFLCMGLLLSWCYPRSNLESVLGEDRMNVIFFLWFITVYLGIVNIISGLSVKAS